MKNLTITLDEKVAAWVRVEAAKADKSMSRWVGDLLADRMDTGANPFARLMRRLDDPPWPSTPEPPPTRAELYEKLYDRPGFPGYERRDLHVRRARSGKTSKSAGVGKASRRVGKTGRKPSGSE
jgi:hypothetical protein